MLDRCEHRLIELCLKLDFYALAVSGHSGFMGAMLADRLGLALLAVRKETDTTRADPSTVNGHIVPGGKYLFVDDLVSSGSTWANCMKNLPACLTCVGAFLYNPQIHPADEFLESGPPPIYTLGGMLETA